ncbi:hypothetical protein PRZ48_011649 [Zasmidium cellare]|uniref:Rhodopsin domain-containing protein n=1 Tax=Zasmidium cellare TaxID=395010 RepID=A0ABR0E711_ZASCE|nr:hypothetical protein PRZ48_011649 [Zasmidium cellare]
MARALSRSKTLGGAGFGWDDHTAFVAYILLTAMAAGDWYAIHYGEGRYIYTLNANSVSLFLMWFYICNILYSVTIFLTKISLVLLYLRLWPKIPGESSRFKTLCLLSLFGLFATMVAFTIACIAQCQPISYVWAFVKGSKGTCIDRTAWMFALGGTEIGWNAVLILLPARRLFTLKASNQRKLGICLVFLVGIVVLICSFVRLKYISGFTTHENFTYFYSYIGLWSTVEAYLSQVCCCMPAVAGLLERTSTYVQHLRHHEPRPESPGATVVSGTQFTIFDPPSPSKATDDMEKYSTSQSSSANRSKSEDSAPSPVIPLQPGQRSPPTPSPPPKHPSRAFVTTHHDVSGSRDAPDILYHDHFNNVRLSVIDPPESPIRAQLRYIDRNMVPHDIELQGEPRRPSTPRPSTSHMSAKAALKAAKTALDNAEYDTAIEKAQSVLSSDPQNHFAKLFLGRALEKQGKYDEAAESYQSAANSKPDDSQAWLGLCSVYEAQGGKKLDEYREACLKVTEIFATADDKHRGQSTIDKLVSFTKEHGTQTQNKKVLELLLPGSPVYDFLDGRIPHPSHTYTRLAEMTEAEESQRISRQINERRTRIGARVGQVTLDVKRETFGNSNLEELYQQVISWSNDDELRRQYEEKLLTRAYDGLVVLPVEEKGAKLDQVLTLAEGMVIIHYPFQKAWDLVLESRDVDDLRELDVHILREYVASFPESGLGRVLKGWLSSGLSPFPPPEKSDDDEEAPEQLTPEDRLLLFTEGIQDAEESPFAHRLVGDYFLHLEEHQSAADTARAGMKAVQTQTSRLGMSFQNTKDALNSVLGTALVHHQAPRNHPEAKRLFEDILQRKPKFTPGLIGLGLIFEETEDYQDAVDFFERALQEDKGNVRVGTELAWCRAQSGDYSLAIKELQNFLEVIRTEDPRDRDLRAQTLYRIGVCLWETDTSKTARRDRNGAYSRFIAAIKTNINFAPAYTSLGYYYADYAKDKKRARQCFQKAFELSSAEVEAAERLARFFADQGDWDIVEVISQRVVDSGRARPPPGSKKKGISWPFSALGVVQMNKQEYQRAITSFLAALRISPEDYQSYVGLGESYHNSGRYNSALRTFNYALEPHDGVTMKVAGETWFAKYMLANVHRELGDFDEATNGLKKVLEERPTEFGVLMSLLQTYDEHAARCLETGLYGQAVENARDAIATAAKIAKDVPAAFNLWKAVGDACSVYSWVQSAVPDFPATEIDDLFAVAADDQMYSALTDVDQVSIASIKDSEKAPLLKPIASAILAYKRAIHSASHDIHAQAVAWYNLGWAEQRAYSCSEPKPGKKYLTSAVRCFKRAIELEAGNYEFWNALGVVTTLLNPKVAQHAFVRSLHINELNAKVWANLGVLYLLQNDNELAHQAFGRAQSTDPDYAHAWLGEGLIALLIGNTTEALNHFTHAFEISDSASLLTKRQYAVSSFDHLLSSSSASNDLTKLIQPIFALEQLRIQAPADLPYRHLSALFLERVGNHTDAITILSDLCTSAEADYEATESLSSLARFALAKYDLARNQLAASSFACAAENAETALDLSSDADSSGLDAESRRKLRLSAHLTAGLAQYYLKQMPDSVSMFKSALQESSNDPDVVCSLVQVLWAQGGSEEKSVAREQLFDAVEKHPEHVGAVTLLGAIAALDNDTDTSLAVRDDLLSLRTKDSISRKDVDGIESLLNALAALESPDSAITEAQTAILLKPDHPKAWSELAELSGEVYAAEMALKTARGAVPPQGDMEAGELSRAFAGVGTIGDAQRAVVLAPWEGVSWKAFGEGVRG